MTKKQIQHLLAYLDYYNGIIDGILGRSSTNAIKKFQEDYGLQVDGIAGEQTQKNLIEAIYGTKKPAVKFEPKSALVVDSGDFWSTVKYFKKSEFACKCGQYHTPYCNGYPAEMRQEVVRLADAARDHFGKPGHIISGLRCRQHNADSGGVSNSQHMYGEACDIQIEGISASQLLAWIQSQKGVRYAYAINSTNVHFDVPQGSR